MFWLRRLMFAALLTLSFGSVLVAQDREARIACRAPDGSKRADNRPHKKKLWDGYEVSLGPVRAVHGSEDGCTAAIYNGGGRVVYRTTGFSVVLDEQHTGLDFDDDGKPDVVFVTDTGGGNHCCWSYNVVSLSPRPHKLFDISAVGRVRFETDGQSKMIVWQRTAGPYGLTSMARTPFAEKAFHVRDGQLTDVTPAFCSMLFSDKNEDYRLWSATLTPAKIERLRSTGTASSDNEEIVSDLLSRALQHVFCRQFDEAAADLNLWPESTKAGMLARFADSIKADYADFAARLRDIKPGMPDLTRMNRAMK